MHGCVRQEGIEYMSKCIHANGVIYEQGSIWTEPSPCSTISEASGLRAPPTTSPGRSRAKANRDKSWCSHISCAAAAMLPACLPQSHDPIFNAVILPGGRRHPVVMCPYVFRV